MSIPPPYEPPAQPPVPQPAQPPAAGVTPPPPYQPYPIGPGSVQPVRPAPVLSILALIFGILGALGSFLAGIGFLPAVAGVVLGFIGRRKEPEARGLWLTGLITGFVGVGISLVIWLFFIVVWAIALSQFGHSSMMGQ